MTSEDVRTPAAPQVPPGSGAPPHAPAAPIEPTPEFTELTARRLGPVRAFFVRHPVVMDVLVMAWFGVPAIFSLLLAGVDAPGGRLTTSRLVTAIVCSLATVVVLWWRRRAPVVARAAGGRRRVGASGRIHALEEHRRAVTARSGTARPAALARLVGHVAPDREHQRHDERDEDDGRQQLVH